MKLTLPLKEGKLLYMMLHDSFTRGPIIYNGLTLKGIKLVKIDSETCVLDIEFIDVVLAK